MDLNMWLQPVDNLFTETAQNSSQFASNGTGIGYLLIGVLAFALMLFLLIRAKRGIGNIFR